MARAHFLERLGGVEQPDGFFRCAVHRVRELQLPDAEVVVCPRFDEQLLDRRRRRVAAGFRDRHGRRLVVEHVDRELRRGADPFAVRAVELDAIEALTCDREAARQRSVRLQRERGRSVVVHHDPSTRRRHRRQNADAHFSAAQRRDVAAALDLLRRKAGVGRVVVFELELPHRGQIDERHREHRRADAGGLDVVVDRLVQMEQHAFEGGRVRGRSQRDAFEDGVGARSHHQRGVGRFEADEPRRHGLIRSARHGCAAGPDVDLIRARRFGAA